MACLFHTGVLWTDWPLLKLPLSLRAQFQDARHDGVDWRLEDVMTWKTNLCSNPHCFSGYSSSMMFSHDSRYLTALHTNNSKDTTTRLWSVVTGQLIREFPGHAKPVVCVAFLLDAKGAATGSWDRAVIFRNVSTGASLATCRGHEGTVTSVAFSASDSLVVSGSRDGEIKVSLRQRY